jgi:hypothetical protein
MILNWTIRPLTAPTVLKNCSRCGCRREFVCSDNFRINAQKKKLDIWLIYRCSMCGCTWNMSIFSRITRDDLDRGLYNGFINNSAELALKYAFDAQTHARNNAAACYDNVLYSVSGNGVPPDEADGLPVILNIDNPYNIQARLDKILNEALGVSRNMVKSCFESGDISVCNAGGDTRGVRLKITGPVTLRINPAVIRKISEFYPERSFIR